MRVGETGQRFAVIRPLTWQDTRQRLCVDRERLRQALFSTRDGSGLYLHASFQCVLLHRLSHQCHCSGWPRMAQFWWWLNTAITGADISAPSDLGPGLLVQTPMGVVIAGRAGRNFTVMANAGLEREWGRTEDIGAGAGLPIVGDDVCIEPHGGVLGPVRVGHRVRIGAGNQVTQHVPDDSDVPSPPARIVARRAVP
jgi:serine O-acetyltransferase